MMRIVKIKLVMFFCLVLGLTTQGQNKSNTESQVKYYKVEGVVYSDETQKPLANIMISSIGARKGAISDSLGQFTIEVPNMRSTLNVTSAGYHSQKVQILKRKTLNVYLVPTSRIFSTRGYESVLGYRNFDDYVGTAEVIAGNDISDVYSDIDNALVGKFAGLQVSGKGGMPGEGSYVNLRGTRSLIANNTPLIVIDGIPYDPSYAVSSSITGYSKSIFSIIASKEVQSVTLLKGAEAGIYGSLGSNGVLLIETEKASDLETKIEFKATAGIAYIDTRLPLLEGNEYKSYIGDIGANKYPDLDVLVDKLPFLLDDPTDPKGKIYNNNTDWQDEIYDLAFQSDYQLKVKGGDGVAKYVLTLGTQQNNGVIKGTNLSKYYTRMNADINFSKKLKLNASGALNFSEMKLQEQGMASYTNPFLTSLYEAPVLSVKQQVFQNGEVVELSRFTPVDQELMMSNPAAVVSDIKGVTSSYDALMNVGLDFTPIDNLVIQGIFGLTYSHNKEDLFIPGKTSHAIAPLMDTLAENTVRGGVSTLLSYYARAQATYSKTFNTINHFNFNAGYQLMTSQKETDNASGINTPTDFYTTLSNVLGAHSRNITGVMEKSSWMNGYASVDYLYNNQLFANVGVTADASSAYGPNGSNLYFFPSVNAGWKVNNTLLRDNDFINNLTLRGEFSEQGNSQFSSHYGRYYYVTDPYKDVVGTYRDMVANSHLKPERVRTLGAGFDLSLLGHVVDISADYFQEYTTDMIIAKSTSAVFGVPSIYDNAGELKTNGVELNLKVNVFQKGAVKWSLGGNIAHYQSKVVDLGGASEIITKYDDGTQLITRVGESPYQFYGAEVEKVFNSSYEASVADYIAQNGERFVAGDIKFNDVNGDQIINDEDRLAIGDPTPDFYGGFYTDLRWKNFGLYAYFSYSYGQDVYNGVRRTTEAMTNFNNQSTAVERRWMTEGQNTDMPRASYGDKTGNSRFSDRWIEDGSYIKMKELTLSYDVNKNWLGFSHISCYITAENLFVWSDYKGMDPEFSYSYDRALQGIDYGKIANPRSVKLGINLNF